MLRFENQLIKFLLILFRCTGFFMLTPIFGRKEIPALGRIGIASLVSYFAYNIVPDIDFGGQILNLLILVLKEITVGISMGYITLLMFSSLYLAGEVIDMEMGFGIVNVIDPQSNTQVPLMGNFYYILTLIIFLTVNGHHVLISAIFKSYDVIPLGKAVFGESFFNAITTSFRDMFIIGAKVSLPIVAIIFVTDFALGIIARTVPQINIFLVGLPIKIFVGIAGLIVILPMYLIALDVIFDGTFDNIVAIIEGMWKGP